MLVLILLLINWMPSLAGPQGGVIFPGEDTSEDLIEIRSSIPKPEPCNESVFNYCGDDVDMYPEDQIQQILEDTLSNGPNELLTAKFFSQDFRNANREPEVDTNLACPSRREFVPQFARAKNLRGQWKYLVQKAETHRQLIEVTICESANKKCVNDADAPESGISDDDKTVCNQIFRTQKMLAVDASGEIEADTFKLPSACVCHFKTFDPFLRFGIVPDEEQNICKKKKKSTPLKSGVVFTELNEAEEDNNDARGKITFERIPNPDIHVRKIETIKEEEKEDSCLATVCEEADSYEVASVDNLVRQQQHQIAKTKVFNNLFNTDCYEDSQVNEKATGETVPTKSGNVSDVSLKSGIFDLREEPLCYTHYKYIFPKKAKTEKDEWVLVVNTQRFQQGVTIGICLDYSKDSSCKYGGQEGYVPDATICKQRYSLHSMLAISQDNTRVYIETFKIPSACICHVNRDLLDFIVE